MLGGTPNSAGFLSDSLSRWILLERLREGTGLNLIIYVSIIAFKLQIACLKIIVYMRDRVFNPKLRNVIEAWGVKKIG